MRIAAGDLDRIIKIEKRRDVQNAVGQEKPTWRTFASQVPSSFEPERGREYFQAQAMTVVDPALFRIRYKAGVNASEFRVIFRQKIWDIAAVLEVGRNDEMRLYCATGLTEG